MESGTVVALKLDRGFGFIHANGRDVFFHASELVGLEFDEQLIERRVEFRAVGTAKGERALDVRPAE